MAGVDYLKNDRIFRDKIKLLLNLIRVTQGVTKRCRLYWLTYTVAPSYTSPNAGPGGGGGRVAGSQTISTAVYMIVDCGGAGGVAGSQSMSTAVHIKAGGRGEGCGVSANNYSCAHECGGSCRVSANE